MRDDDSSRLTRRELLQATAGALVSSQVTGPLGSVARAAAAGRVTVAGYILSRLREQNVEVLFGIPGATCEALFGELGAHGLEAVVTSSDLAAGQAADGYARMRGLGAVAVTYGVGMMGLLAAISGAYAEHSPVVVLNGGPSREDLELQRDWGTSFTHSNGRTQTDLGAFREVTCHAERVTSASELPEAMDRALVAALTEKRPVYLEVDKSLWESHCAAPAAPLQLLAPQPGAEAQVAKDVVARLQAASRPALLLGVELDRRGLAKEAAALVEHLQLPWATTFLGKSVIPESTPGFLGVYSGEHAVPAVREALEGADAVLALGCVMGRQYRHLVTHLGDKLVRVGFGEVRVAKTRGPPASLEAVVAQLQAQPWRADPARRGSLSVNGLSFEQRRASVKAPAPPANREPGASYDEVLSAVSAFVDDGFVVLTDTSLSMYPAAELNVHGARSFVCDPIWQFIGYSVGAAVGVGLAQARRPLVLCGDGGFQMTAQSLSSLASHKVRAIVLVLDNGHYGIEQYLVDGRYFAGAAGRPYLALNRWDYVGLARAMGFAQAESVSSVDGLRKALEVARGAQGPALIAVRVPPRDLPAELRRG